jgi:hypothetical protein
VAGASTASQNPTSSMPNAGDIAMRVRSNNRAKYPELAAAVDCLRATFGQDQVRVVRPLDDVTWHTMPTQVWPCKAPRAASWK